ncbi:hypothetical protein EW146_g1722 [Bondarzewia mesenterica]|uniref:Uncharacterized protein n=1 Tax=Bondarzewia mesenterica TaxID=1095465 RepID=A0A4S4M315_9AGAM|nr:hypothetical protein EW146_g1722 [Bondarzewia mesenterica]
MVDLAASAMIQGLHTLGDFPLVRVYAPPQRTALGTVTEHFRWNHHESAFAEALQEHFPDFVRCSQDELGDRRKVESLARRSLHEGLSVCIDRTNVDAVQRSHWINIAREFPGTAAWVIFFDTPHDVCVSRLKDRRDHPTIRDVVTGLRVLERFASTFEQPHPHEGFERLITIVPSDHPSADYTRGDVLSIIQRVRDSPFVDVAAALPGEPRITEFFSSRREMGSANRPRGFGSRASTSYLGHSPWPSNTSHRASRGGWTSRGAASVHSYASSYGTYVRGARWNTHERGQGQSGRVGGGGGAASGPSWRGSGSAQDPLTLE